MRTRVTIVVALAALLALGVGVAQAATSRLPSGRTSYRTYNDYVRELAAIAKDHPTIARGLTLAEKSVQGRPIRAVELASSVQSDYDGRPTFLVTGLTHAREWSSGEVAMEFARDLAARYGRDPRITRLLKRVRVVILPVLNPDGFVVSRAAPAGTRARAHRTNCALTGTDTAATPCADRAGVDINRNQASGWGGAGADIAPGSEIYRGPRPWSEPESQGLHELMAARQVTGMISLHNYEGSVLRQPGYRAFGSLPDEKRQAALGQAMANAAGYVSERADQLYEATGGQEDWSYAHQDSLAYTIEIGGTSFQGPYRTAVIDQYLGTPRTATAGHGLRDALLLAAEASAKPAGHGVIEGQATAERILKVQRTFVTVTSPVCVTNLTLASGCPSPLTPMRIPDGVATWTRVPPGGHFHVSVSPSTDPADERAGRSTAWTVKCQAPEGFALGTTRTVTVQRGQVRVLKGVCTS
jgi:hypothetical protein